MRAWLVRHDGTMGTNFAAPNNDFENLGEGCSWTVRPSEALAFARRIDATAFADAYCGPIGIPVEMEVPE